MGTPARLAAESGRTALTKSPLGDGITANPRPVPSSYGISWYVDRTCRGLVAPNASVAEGAVARAATASSSGVNDTVNDSEPCVSTTLKRFCCSRPKASRETDASPRKSSFDEYDS